ncbi:ATP-dependent Clp protease ATP-binding subunit [Porphyromonadaceae bacterium W3.11]|nr:ATP-dependent Clp protease ATP-binding subunit [Porphyromonadaceae bacterium W3.11]
MKRGNMLEKKDKDILYNNRDQTNQSDIQFVTENPFKDDEDKGKDEYGELMNSSNSTSSDSSSAKRSAKKKSDTPTLDKFGTWLNEQAKEDKLDPIYGREDELQRIAQILSRKKKNNPLLLGEPGVGKTAIVEALAQRIVRNEVPIFLLNKRIVEVDLGSIVAGSMYRGQFEERMKGMIQELKSHPDIILYIDEIHTIIGSGNTQGGLDAANILKPALSRGEIRCIGATTLEEYRKTIEKDGAMDRRFQKIVVPAPDNKETLAILKKLRPRYEEHHHVKYSEEALEAAVKLSDQYVTDRFFPDKAIDALDEAGAYAFMKGQKPVDFSQFDAEIEEMRALKLKAVQEGDYEMASKYRDEEKASIQKLEEYKEALESGESMTEDVIVTVEDVERVVSLSSGVPIESFTKDDLETLSKLGDRLREKVIGQDHVVEAVASAIQRNKVGLRDPSKPIGTFLFLGSSGVGKTHLSKKLAKELFGSEDAMIRIDMSEFMEKHTVSRLVGAPPGYVGYDEGGELTKKVKRRPYSVILFDEIEKAHADVHNLLLQLLDDGVLTDSNGGKVNFKNTIIIMTSNVGTRQLNEFGTGIGFRDSKTEDVSKLSEEVIQKMLKKTFAPEFLNRIDKIVTFNALSIAAIRKIVAIELKELDIRLKELKLNVTYSDRAMEFLAKKGFDPKYGARPLKRAIATYVEELITQGLLDGDITEGHSYHIDIDNDDNSSKLVIKEPELIQAR